jgi:hypothetical protein
MQKLRKPTAVVLGVAYFVSDALLYRSARFQFLDAVLIDIPVTILAGLLIGFLWAEPRNQ